MRLLTLGTLVFALAACGGGVGDVDLADATDLTVEADLVTLDIPAEDIPAEAIGDGLSLFDADIGCLDDCLTADLGPEPGQTGWPCTSSADCSSGYCIETGSGGQCTTSCVEECPYDWECRQLAGGSDVNFICVPSHLDLCRPCLTNDDCASNDVLSGATCVAYGPAGFFCGRDCATQEDCPEGYQCTEATDVTGGQTLQCSRIAEACECMPRFVSAGASTTCYQENLAGLCLGTRTCRSDGLSPCSAQLPAAEICNGLDDDCDGETDEETGGADCLLPNAYGICQGTIQCEGGEPVCKGEEAQPETCDGLDNDCDGVPDNADLVCAGCSGGICPVVGVNDGSILEGVDLYYQYSPLGAGDGFVRANWLAAEGATGYVVRIGSTPGADNVLADSELDAVVSAELSGLSLAGAWTGAVYFVTVKPLAGDGAVGDGATSNGIRIAEAASWDGLSTVGMSGGFTEDWPEAGITAFYGRHYFETVTIAADTVVRVQGWGKADGVTESIAASHVAVTSPTDGWLELYANTIEVAGTVTASGRGYGGGGGGGGGSVSSSNRGRGGANGLGGDGGAGEGSSAGGGGGGSPGGKGGYGAQGNGGNGNLLGGGSGATACTGHAGRDGGDGPVGEVGGTGGTAGSGVVGAGGAGEFGKGGANGVVGCDNWTGGGGGGYGAGASGGTQWTGGGTDAGGGGGGGSGGVGGGETPHGGKGAGPFGGNAGSANASAGSKGGYLGATVNGDSSADRSLALGSGGGGGGAGIQETGGGGGGAGGGWLVLYALDSLTLTATSRVLANGAGAGGGGRDDGGHSTSYTGGTGAGGGIRLEAANLHIDGAAHVSSRGGNGSTSNGGTIKLFYEALTGSLPPNSRAGRVYDAGEGSFE